MRVIYPDDGVARVLDETVRNIKPSGSLEMTFTDETYVEISDSNGAVVIAELYDRNNPMSLEIAGYFEILIGNVDATTVYFNGNIRLGSPGYVRLSL